MTVELWQNARRQVAEFEQRSNQLSLVLSAEKTALEAVEREVKKMEQERATLVQRTQEADTKRAEVQQRVEELRAAASRAAKDSTVLQKHMELLRASSADAGKQMERDCQRYQQHLSNLRAQLTAYQEHVGGVS